MNTHIKGFASSLDLHKLAIIAFLILASAICCQAGLFDQIANGLKDVTQTANVPSEKKVNINHASPEQLFEMIGNPQVDLDRQGSAYRKLVDSAANISSREAKVVNIESAYYLAECYVTGKTGKGGPDYLRNKNGFPPNRPEAYKLAIPLYASAAQYDHILSLVKLSSIYADGNYELKDLNKSLTYLVRAAKLGDKPSLESLSQLYSGGFVGVTDENVISTSIEALASLGNPDAQLALSKKAAAAEALQKQQDEARQTAAAQKAAADETLQKQQAEAEQAAAVQKNAADKQQAEEQAAVTPKPVGNESLKYPQVEAQLPPGSYKIIQRTPPINATKQEADDQINDVKIFIVCLALVAAWLTFAVLGISLGIRDRAVIFWGKRDVYVSAMASIIFIIQLICLALPSSENSNDGTKSNVLPVILVTLVINIFLLVYSARRSYIANNMSLLKTLVVVPAKLAISGIIVISGVLTYGFAKSAFVSAAKAKNMPGYTEEQRNEKLRHQKDALSSAALASFMGYATYRLYEFVKKLIKENPAQALEDSAE